VASVAREKVKRRISTGTYLAALILTVLVFSLGIYVGMIIDEQAQGELERGISELEEELYFSRILLLAQEEIGEFCPIYSENLEAVAAERELIGDRLEYLEEVRGVYDTQLKERYFYLELENYLLLRKMQDQCAGEQVLVLFFYGEGEDSLEQGRVLDSLRAKNGEVKVFSFDGEMDSAVVEALTKSYGVNSYPSLVIDGETVSGLKGLGEIESVIGGN
jgi:hypothetical protein